MNKKFMHKMRSIITRTLLKNLTISMGILIFTYVLFDFLLMPIFTRHWQSVAVPDVTHLSSQAADKLLSKAGLIAAKGPEKYDENFPPGFVLFQNPKAGSPVKKGRRIYLTVGKGEKVFPMPLLVGKPERDVKFLLEQLNLHLGSVTFENDSFYHEGVVSNQSIEPETQVAVGTSVDLVVSIGIEPTEFVVPDLVGKSEDNAKLSIKKAGLTLGGITYQETDKLVPSTVINQSLQAGLDVAKGDTLDIVVSKLAGSEEGKKPW